jgi:hypothetical protein
MDGLRSGGIDTRLWYGSGLAAHPLFANRRLLRLQRRGLDGNTLIGLPTAPDLSVHEVHRICSAINALVAADPARADNSWQEQAV